MVKELADVDFKKAMRSVMENAELELEAVNTAELSVDKSAAVGACCTYTIGLSSCTGGVTYNSCRSIANKYGLAFKWSQGKQCTQVSCP